VSKLKNKDVAMQKYLVRDKITTSSINVSFSQVYIDALLCGTILYKEGVNPYTIECGSHMARQITVVGGAVDGYLTLCEVEVFSSNPPGLP
jgi:hypothetical protein